MERQMGGIQWNLDAWSKRYVEQRGSAGLEDLTRMVVAIAPQTGSTKVSGADGSVAVADWVRQLVADPAYQLK
jgi:hypothetical protein